MLFWSYFCYKLEDIAGFARSSNFILLEHIKPLVKIWLKTALENVSRYGFNNNLCSVNNSLQKPLLAKRLLKGSFYPQKQRYHLMKIFIGGSRTYVVSCILIFLNVKNDLFKYSFYHLYNQDVRLQKGKNYPIIQLLNVLEHCAKIFCWEQWWTKNNRPSKLCLLWNIFIHWLKSIDRKK